MNNEYVAQSLNWNEDGTRLAWNEVAGRSIDWKLQIDHDGNVQLAGGQLACSVAAHIVYSMQTFLPRCMECRRRLAMRILSVRPSVCLSVKRVHCHKTSEYRFKIGDFAPTGDPKFQVEGVAPHQPFFFSEY